MFVKFLCQAFLVLPPQSNAHDFEPSLQIIIGQKNQHIGSKSQLKTVAAKKNDAVLIPFLLEGVAGHSNLNLPDGIHPNVKGHEIVAGNVYKVIKEIL